MGKEGVKTELYGLQQYLLRKVTILHLRIYQAYSCAVQWCWISLGLFHYIEMDIIFILLQQNQDYIYRCNQMQYVDQVSIQSFGKMSNHVTSIETQKPECSGKQKSNHRISGWQAS